MNVNLPKSFIRTTVKAELNCFAYYSMEETLHYIAAFVATDDGMQANMDVYPLPHDNPIAKYFDTGFPSPELILLIDTVPLDSSDISDEKVKQYCDILDELFEYINNTSCIHHHEDVDPMDIIKNSAADNDQPDDNDIIMNLKEQFPSFGEDV